ncbi:DUF2905 domain-containing protein [Chitinophaga rhizosphaerae]|uniref:DUF2905 domain-containing protein n=1 Tax=Chitinophaga rhizosphaerae TaxID=1864947 RepID=UPI000F8026AC|nr:DUF2905 domain-containing protein [Chitinophaga rhizosphaerae]
MNPQLGKQLIMIGLLIVALGIMLYFFSDKLRWFGRLPGDIRIEKENVRFYFPVTSMLIVSLVISLLLYGFRKLF